MTYQRITLAQLKARLTDRVGNNEVFWVGKEKQDAINEAICVWQALTGYWTEEFVFTPPVSGNWQDTPSQVASIQSLRYNNGEIPLTSLFELDFGSPGWEGTNGSPAEWSPAGLTLMILRPGYSGSGTVTVRGIKEAPTLENAGDYIDIGDEELDKLLGYAHHILSFKEGNPEFEATQGQLQEFIAAAAFRNARFAKSAFYKNFMGAMRDESERRLEGEGRQGAR